VEDVSTHKVILICADICKCSAGERRVHVLVGGAVKNKLALLNRRIRHCTALLPHRVLVSPVSFQQVIDSDADGSLLKGKLLLRDLFIVIDDFRGPTPPETHIQR
jgi:hypothetical protein